MAALIRHTGRRSGRAYTTPVSGRRSGDIVLLTLTFGNQSDWVRNVRAACGCSIRIDGQDYDLARPRFLTRQEARPQVAAAFGPIERAGFRMLGIRQVMRLDIVPAKS
jgi:deazaflavin-dependent oxidoreductase (nitroreductase family)